MQSASGRSGEAAYNKGGAARSDREVHSSCAAIQARISAQSPSDDRAG